MLMNRKVSINQRLRLFNATVTKCVLWCCESWTLKVEDTAQLRTAFRSMLRKMVGLRRYPDQSYLDWIGPATRQAVRKAAAVNVYEWPEEQKKLKWNWAGHVARSGAQTWVSKTTFWRDSNWQKLMMTLGVARPLRPSRRRWAKWEDSVRRHCETLTRDSWTTLANDRAKWKVGSESLKLL